jgi:hypothetical protein
MKTKKVLLTRQWSGHAAGEIVEEWEVTADSMIRKGFGTEYREPPRRRPRAETADAPPVAETADATPESEQPEPVDFKARTRRTGKAGD